MTIASPCISRDRLHEFTLGYLDDEESGRIELHLQECSICDETLAELDEATDSLLREIRRQPPASQYGHDNQCQQAIDRLQEIDLVRSETNGNLSAAAYSNANGQLLRDYRLIRVIGSGGMGTVYQAVHTRLQRPVAVKVLPERRLRDAVAVLRFQREMLTIGKLDHPAIVRATDAGEFEGTHFLVMELVEGIDLSRLVKIRGALLAADACELVRQAAAGIEHGHRLGIVHRDIKPSNLMLNRNGQVKILDLGLAMLGGLQNPVDDLTTVGQLMGTLDYMAPEQCGDSHEVGERADIYALGATLYKLLCGHAPYSGPSYRTALQKLRAVGNEPIPLLQTRGVNIPDELARVVHRALEFDPQDRFATSAEFGAALAPFTTGSDLVSLCAEAEQADRESRDAEFDSIQSANGSVLISAENRLLAQNSDQLPAKQSESAALPNRSRILWRALVATALLALFAFAGIVIYLETGRGTLTIESAEDSVEITIKKAGRIYEKLQLKQGANSLRVGAGKYEIEITGEHDALEIEDGVFTLKRGDDWIARVSESPPAVDVARRQPRVAETKVAEPTFEGKTFQEWLAQYQTERSITVQVNALTALKKLSDSEEQTREAIRTIFQYYRPTKNAGTYVDALSHWPRETVIDETKRVLASGSTDARNLALQTLQYGSMLADLPQRDRNEILQSIEKLMGSEDADTRIAAIQFLLRQSAFSDAYAKRLAELMKDENRTVAVEAATALVFVQPEFPGLAERLVELARSAETPSQGCKALHGLMVLGKSAEQVKEQLMRMLDDDNPKYLQTCGDYWLAADQLFRVELRKTPLDSWDISIKFSPPLNMRNFVIMSLGEIGPPAAAVLPKLEKEWESYFSTPMPQTYLDSSNQIVISNRILIQAIGNIRGENWREIQTERVLRFQREHQSEMPLVKSDTPEKDLPLYNGRPLTYWLTQLTNDPLHPERFNELLSAIQALRDDDSSQPYLKGAIAGWLKSAKRERNPEKLGWAARVICGIAGKKLSAAAIDAVYEIAAQLPSAQLEDDEPVAKFFVDANLALDQVDDQLLNERFVKELRSGDSTSRAFTLRMLHQQIVGPAVWDSLHSDSFRQYFHDHRQVVTESFMAASQDADPPVALAALRNLIVEMEVKDDAIKQKLVEFMSAADKQQAFRATEMMARIDPTNRPLLVTAKVWSASGDPSLELQAAEIYMACVMAGNEAAIDAMLELLSHEDWGLVSTKPDNENILCPREYLIYLMAKVETTANEKVLERFELEAKRIERQATSGTLTGESTLRAIYDYRTRAEQQRKDRNEGLREGKEEPQE